MKGKKVLFSHKSDDWSTPANIYSWFVSECGYFDPCPLRSSFDGLSIKWHGDVFCNPPYSNILAFVEKGIAYHCSVRGCVKPDVVFLLPVRTDTKWFKILADYGCDIKFLHGRLKFGGSSNCAPFPSMLVSLEGSSASDLSSGCFEVVERGDEYF